MKALIIGLLTLASASAFSISGDLDGQKFCRTVHTGGGMGQRPGIRTHCLSFNGGVARDNIGTFVGNPPTSYTYRIEGNKIVNVDNNKVTGLLFPDCKSIMTMSKKTLKLVK